MPGIQLLNRTTCPHCWKKFPPEDILWISSHSDLRGDPRLGPDHQQRFLPTRFTIEGNALDARNFVCHRLACPGCHLVVPAQLLETEPSFVSILGTPACGKSFFLAAMTWELKRVLPAYFNLSFTSTDPTGNRILEDYQESLFNHPTADRLVPLAALIHKTELQGGQYDTVSYGTQTVSYPRPFLFTLRPLERHPNARAAHKVSRVLALYDNAGEHFQPGQETTASPVTRHMAEATVLVYLFDPMQDPHFRQQVTKTNPKVAALASPPARQETVLYEAANRVRQSLGLPAAARHGRPLLVVVTKADLWGHMLQDGDWREPWNPGKEALAGLDVARIEQRSANLRALLNSICPEVVGAAEDFCRDVVYIPVSALGRLPEVGQGPGGQMIRPADIRPVWATVPMLYAMNRFMPGLVPSLKRPTPQSPRPSGKPTAPGKNVRRT